jgi:circadian clock protein KaiC
MKDSRIPTGVSGLDEILHGGLIPGYCYLLTGPAGTGKTILSLQWLMDGCRRGEKGLYLALCEDVGKVRKNMAALGWSLEGVEMVDITPQAWATTGHEGEYTVFPPSEVEQPRVWGGLYSALEEHRPKRAVVDSATHLRYLSTDEYQFRMHILGLVGQLSRHGCTSILTFEPSELERETALAMAVDGVIRLRREVSSGGAIEIRSLDVEKLRGSGYVPGLHHMRITEEGVVVFPHRIERGGGPTPGQEGLSSGIEALDELLGGGIESGTTTIISGPTGVGKSTLGLHFLLKAAEEGMDSILYTFEESIPSILWRSRALGMQVDGALEEGSLRIVHVNAMGLYPDEFLGMVRRDVEDGRRVVMVDSLRGYQLAMEQFGTLGAHLQNLINFILSRGASTFLINEVEQITGDLSLTELGVSFLMDNALLLRYAEYRGGIIRVVGCLKKRLGAHQSELREFRITPEGLHVGEKLKGLRGVLTGVPERVD